MYRHCPKVGFSDYLIGIYQQFKPYVQYVGPESHQREVEIEGLREEV